MDISHEALPATNQRTAQPDPPAPDLHARPRVEAWVAVLAAGLVALALLVAFPALDQPFLHSGLGHVLIAGASALLGAGLALLVLRMAVHAADARVFLVGLGFLSVASIFFIHAISTPGVLLTGRVVATSWSAPISLALGGVFFALSGLPIGARLNQLIMRRARLWLVVFLLCWLAYGWLVLVTIPAIEGGAAATAVAAAGHEHGVASAAPSSGAAILPPATLEALHELITFGGLACYLLAVWLHARLYGRVPAAAGLAIIGGIGLLGEALLTQRFWTLYGASFWLSHAQEAAGFAAISYAVLRAHQRGERHESVLEGLFLANTRARMQADYAATLDALADALARGEHPSPALSGALRLRLGMSEAQVRVFDKAADAMAQERRQRHELEQLNAELRQLERYRDQLTQLVVHDLKNPLTAMIGYLDLLRLSGLDDDQGEYLRRAQLNGYNLAAQINDLLDISRLEDGQLELERALFTPRALLDDCAAQMNAWAAQEQQQLYVESEDEATPYYGDVRLLRRMLLNLISNAIKHNPPETTIVLRALRPAQPAAPSLPPLVFEVSDTGRGIPPAALDRIFEKYGRADGPRPARQSSSGLGLTLCRLVAQVHGGSISVQSAVDAGSTFRVALPAVEPPAEP